MNYLRHPNVINIKAYCMKPYALVMELAPYGDLYRLLHDPSKELKWPYKV
jgi:hypothetical protein